MLLPRPGGAAPRCLAHFSPQFLRQGAIDGRIGAKGVAVRGQLPIQNRRAHAPINSRPINMRRISFVPAPMSSNLAFILPAPVRRSPPTRTLARSEEHTSELQSLMRISYAVFC